MQAGAQGWFLWMGKAGAAKTVQGSGSANRHSHFGSQHDPRSEPHVNPLHEQYNLNREATGSSS
jgi:hypothetical protein